MSKATKESAVHRGTNAQQGVFSRRVRLGMGLAAALCFGIAFVHHNTGAAHYSSYISAYMECASDSLFGIHAVELCKTTPTVRGHLEAHTLAYAMVVPMLSLGLSLGISALCLPLTTRRVRRREQAVEYSGGSVAAPAAS